MDQELVTLHDADSIHLQVHVSNDKRLFLATAVSPDDDITLGVARRRVGDKHIEGVGERLAIGRALIAMGNALIQDAQDSIAEEERQAATQQIFTQILDRVQTVAAEAVAKASKSAGRRPRRVED